MTGTFYFPARQTSQISLSKQHRPGHLLWQAHTASHCAKSPPTRQRHNNTSTTLCCDTRTPALFERPALSGYPTAPMG